MNIEKILEGLAYRLESLTQARDALLDEDGHESIINEFEVRADEIESLIQWVETYVEDESNVG